MPPYSTSFPWEVTPGPNQQPISSHQGRPQSYSAVAFYTNASQTVSTTSSYHAADNHQRAPSRLASNGDSERYTLADAQAGRDPREFAITMLDSPQIAILPNVVDQLKAVYNAIDLPMRKDLTRPGPHSTIEHFLKQLDGCKSKWYSVASSEQTPSTQTPSTQTPSTQTPSTQTPSTQTPSSSSSGYYFASSHFYEEWRQRRL